MTSLSELHDALGACRAAVSKQGEKVKNLKKKGTAAADQGTDLEAEVATLLSLKKKLVALEQQLDSSRPFYTKCRVQLENLARRRSFFFPAFEIYGGVAGLFDWGPPGCALKAEVETLWRQHFVLEEDMLEVAGTCLTPHNVLKTSGHVDRFCDLMTADTITGECFRADKLLEDFVDMKLAGGTTAGKSSAKQQHQQPLSQEEIAQLERIRRQADAYTSSEMAELFESLHITSPSGNPLSAPFPFNLMFKTRIGPKDTDASTAATAYLRPETAQGIIVNFRRLLEYNGGRLPFAAAQLGLGFRNEIAPRNGLLRVREFQMGEIEYFVHPDEKSHPKFVAVSHLKLPLFPRERQLTDGRVQTDISLGDAVASGMIGNECLAYFMARTYLFLTTCGIQECGLRFRQHLATEMAHYASDCWDAEVETSYGWVECVGHADRSAYDLSHHMRATKVPLVAMRRLDQPKTIEVLTLTPNRQLLGPAFKKDQALVLQTLENKPDQEKLAIEAELEAHGQYILDVNGVSFTLTRPMIKFEHVSQKISEESFVPAVIEPSFGIGRIIYCILEHTFRSRGIEDQQERCFLALPPAIAPTKCSLLSISSNALFEPLLSQLKTDMTRRGVSCKLDTSTASIGKRYARTDEIGIPYGITVDFQSVQDATVTLRERDTMKQVRIPGVEAPEVVAALSRGHMTWKSVLESYPPFIEQETS